MVQVQPDEKFLVVGFGAILGALDPIVPPRSVVVVDEPDMIRSRGLLERVGDHPCVSRVVPGPVQAEDDEESVLRALDRPSALEAVIPANEYGVVAAARLAAAWDLPGAGVRAARVFRDKSRLRAAVEGSGVRQPRWEVVGGSGDVARFRAGVGGYCVLKPANRQASLGVSLLGPQDSVEVAWQRAAQVDESWIRTVAMPPARMLAEEWVRGPEVSVEALVHEGSIVFENVTAKRVAAGPHPVETGHSVPASLPGDVAAELSVGMRRLVEATSYRSGVLHAEWLLAPDGPYLVECAARMPGDNIKDLIDLAYDADLIRDYVEILSGRRDVAVAGAVRGAAVRFLLPEPGRVRAVTGVEEAREQDGVHEVAVTVEVGDTVGSIESSWQRVGHVIAVGDDGDDAAARAERAGARIQVLTGADA